MDRKRAGTDNVGLLRLLRLDCTLIVCALLQTILQGREIFFFFRCTLPPYKYFSRYIIVLKFFFPEIEKKMKHDFLKSHFLKKFTHNTSIFLYQEIDESSIYQSYIGNEYCIRGILKVMSCSFFFYTGNFYFVK